MLLDAPLNRNISSVSRLSTSQEARCDAVPGAQLTAKRRMDLEDSDAEEIQPVPTSNQRPHSRLRKAPDTLRSGHGRSDRDASEAAADRDSGDASSDITEPLPSRITPVRQRSTRAAAAVARRRLSDAAADLQQDSGPEQDAASDAAEDSSLVISSDDVDEQPAEEEASPDEESSPDEWPDASPPAKAPKPTERGGTWALTADAAAHSDDVAEQSAEEKASPDEESSPDEWPDASPPAKALQSAQHGSTRVPSAGAVASRQRSRVRVAAAGPDSGQSDADEPPRAQVGC